MIRKSAIIPDLNFLISVTDDGYGWAYPLAEDDLIALKIGKH
jgi:hypothetical protein